MSRADLEALAARVEALTGPCRETDAQIARYAPHLVAFLGGVPDKPQYGGKHYTASLDDAVDFLDGRDWSMAADCDSASATVLGNGPEHGHAAIPALALTAAGLRALSAQ